MVQVTVVQTDKSEEGEGARASCWFHLFFSPVLPVCVWSVSPRIVSLAVSVRGGQEDNRNEATIQRLTPLWHLICLDL